MKHPLIYGAVCTVSLALPLSAADQDIDSNQPDRWQFTQDTVARLKSDVIYEGIERQDSNSYSSPLGAVFHSSAGLVITSEGELDPFSLTFDGNTKNTAGGMVVANNDLIFEWLDNLTFTGNSAATTTGSAVRTGIAALSQTGDIYFRNMGNVLLEGNTSSNGRGIGFITAYSGSVFFENTGDLIFRNNNGSTASSAMIYSRDGRSDEHGVVIRNARSLAITDNTAQGIYSISGVLISKVDSVRFVNSIGAQDGGAIFSRSFSGDGKSVAIVQSGDVLFEGNHARARGGAIEVELMNDDNTERSIILSADKGDIVFKGNVHEDDTTLGYNNPVANSIYINVNGSNYQPSVFGTLEFRAQEGREVAFYDPIVTGQLATGHAKAQTGVTVIDFNKVPAAGGIDTAEYDGNVPSQFNGTIRFSGKETANYITRSQTTTETASAYQTRLEQSRYSNVIAHTTVHNGTLIVEHDAVYGNKDLAQLRTKGMQSSFTVQQGTLDMNNRGVVNACTLAFSGTDAIIRTDGTGVINALTADMSGGISVDLGYYFSGDAVVNNSGLRINSEQFTLGGTISIADEAAGYYASERWAEDQSFTLFVMVKQSGSFGSFADIMSGSYGSSLVDGLDGYQGMWTFDEKVSGNTMTVTAHWTALGTPIPEPSSLLLALGAVGMLARRRK